MRALALLLTLSVANAADLSSLSRQIFDSVNSYRRDAGLQPLRWNAAAAEEARKHCGAIVAGKRAMGHDGFEQRMARLRKVVRVDAGAENIASIAPVGNTPSRTVDLWSRSGGHRRNMIGDYQLSGIGSDATRDGQVCVTQIFIGGPR